MDKRAYILAIAILIFDLCGVFVCCNSGDTADTGRDQIPDTDAIPSSPSFANNSTHTIIQSYSTHTEKTYFRE